MYKLTKIERLQALAAWIFFIIMMLPQSVSPLVISKDWDELLTSVAVLILFYVIIRNSVLSKIYDKFNV